MQKESGTNKSSNVLIITSFLDNGNSSKMIWDISKSLNNYYHVDVITKYPFDSNEINVYSAYNKYDKLRHDFFARVRALLLKFKFLQAPHKFESKENLPYYFFGLDDEKPPVNTKKIINRIKKEYDFILVFFWQGLVTSKTLKDIYDKFEIPFLLVAADMFPMTGGCSYFWDCERVKLSCGKCQGILSSDENDATRKNFLYKKNVFSNIKSVFLGNNWQNRYARESGLFQNIGTIYPIVDETVFQPRDKDVLKKNFNYSDKKVLFFGSLGVHDPRKGFKYLLEALQLLNEKRPDLVSNIVLVVAGSGEKVEGLEEFNIDYIGHLTFNQLAEYYALADVFLSPSIQDAGPMMLNQALMCGTPAVAFNIGTACDIINEGTGYLAKFKDSEDFCNGIISLVTKNSAELEAISKNCRTESMPRSSYEGFSSGIINAYNMIN